MYSEEDRRRLEFIAKAKRLGFSLEDIRDVLALHEQRRTPCRHVLALLDQKLSQVDGALKELRRFRGELARLRHEASERLEQASAGAAICGIIERGIHAKGEAALAWLEFRRTGRRGGREKSSRKLAQGLDFTVDWKG